MDLDDIEFNENAHRCVTEYPWYADRLREVDWKAALESDELFEDPTFPADVSSILDSDMPEHPMAARWSKFSWKRPGEFYGEGKFSLYEKVSPDDIKQGLCGDCYFLAGLSALAENPERVGKIFVQDFTNK